jgi:choline dehydrogenase-like flavoprotein
MQFDAIIIGSGAGGAPIAHTLVNQGKSVLILEKGPLLKPQYQNASGLSDFKRDELFATGPEKKINLPVANRGASFYSSHVEPDLNDEPHVYRERDGSDRATIEGYTAQVVGGGTQLYGGVSLRFSPVDLRLKSFNEGRNDLRNDPNGEIQHEARDWPVSYDDLEPCYCKAEKLVGINGTSENQIKPFSNDFYQKPLPPNPISRFIEQGMSALNMPRYRTPLAVITEDHAASGRKVTSDAKTAFVNRYGDPLGYKSNTWVSLLTPIAGSPNFELRSNSVVTHLESSGSRVTRVHYRDGGGTGRTVEGKIIVVACSAIESVRLLKISGMMDSDFNRRINQNELLGKYFLTHSFGGADAKMPGRYDKSMTLDSDWATDFCGTDAFLKANGLWAGATIYNNTSDRALPISLARTHGAQDLDNIWRAFVDDTRITGERMVQFLDDSFGTHLSITFMANQVPVKTNRIELHPSVRDKWGRPVAYIIKGWHTHDMWLMDVMAEQCAKILRAGGAIEEPSKGGVYHDISRIANHVLGGARFGSDPADSVLDPDCRAWQFDNLYVTDGSFMPTSGSGNPTLTIQANAFRVGDILAGRV